MGSKKNILRFSVGSKKSILSSVWKLWEQNNHVYLMPVSNKKSLIKLSMHVADKDKEFETGDIRWAITEEIISNNMISSRVLADWYSDFKPTDVESRGPALAILIPPIKEPFVRNSKSSYKDTKYLPEPPPYHLYEIELMLLRSDFSNNEILNAQVEVDSISTDAGIVGLINRKDGVKIVVFYRCRPMLISEKEYIKNNIESIRINYSEWRDRSSDYCSIFATNTDEDGTPMLMEYPMGQENLRFTGEINEG